MSAATAGIDAKYVVAASQPGPHGIQPAVFAQPSLLGSIRPLVLKGPHARTTAIPTPRKRPMTRSLRAYTTPGKTSRNSACLVTCQGTARLPAGQLFRYDRVHRIHEFLDVVLAHRGG